MRNCPDKQEISASASSVQDNERAAQSYATKQKLRDQTLVSVFSNLGAFSQRHNAVKLGLILVGLWVLNWIY
jgi:hypothetical protein